MTKTTRLVRQEDLPTPAPAPGVVLHERPGEADTEAEALGEAPHEHRIKPAGEPIYATLVAPGKTYSLHWNRRVINFQRGVPVKVSAEIAQHLETYGVDKVTEVQIDDESGRKSNVGAARPKFKFSTSSQPAAA